jgi:hypothetical protein
MNMNLIKYYLKRTIPWLRSVDPFDESNDRLKCIFVHIPKCGGISVKTTLGLKRNAHVSYIEYKITDAARCLRYTKFTVVRDPIDRFVSAFYFLKSGGRNPTDLAWSQEHLSGSRTPEELIEAMRTNSTLLDSIFKWQHFRPQYTFLLGERDQIEMDHILRFNYLEVDFNKLSKALGVSVHLAHENKTKSKAKRVLSLAPESIGFLKEQYREDYLRLAEYF